MCMAIQHIHVVHIKVHSPAATSYVSEADLLQQMDFFVLISFCLKNTSFSETFKYIFNLKCQKWLHKNSGAFTGVTERALSLLETMSLFNDTGRPLQSWGQYSGASSLFEVPGFETGHGQLQCPSPPSWCYVDTGPKPVSFIVLKYRQGFVAAELYLSTVVRPVRRHCNSSE